MDFYFSTVTAETPVNGKDRHFPTKLAYIPALGEVIEYTASTEDPNIAKIFEENGQKLVAKDIGEFALIRCFRLVNNPEVWTKYHEDTPEQFTKALADVGLSPEALLEAWNAPNTKHRRAIGTTIFYKRAKSQHMYYPRGDKKQMIKPY